MKRILVSEAGGAPSINVVKSLRVIQEDIEIIGISSDVYLLRLSDVDKKYLVPSAHDPQFLPVLLQIIEKIKPDIILSQNDAVVSVLSKNRETIPAKLFLPSHTSIELCHDKYASYATWQKAGIPVPHTFLITSPDDLKKAFTQCSGKIWLRAISGWSGKGALLTEDVDFATAWITYHKGWGNFTAAEYLSPHSVTFMSIWYHGELIVAQSRKRIEWRFGHHSISGVTGQTGVGITVDDEKVTKTALTAVKAVDAKPHGIFSVDMTLDNIGIPNPTEINIGRFFATSHFFTDAGLNMVEVVVNLLYGKKPLLPQPINPLPTDLVWIRQIDAQPVLATKAEIDALEQELFILRNKISKS